MPKQRDSHPGVTGRHVRNVLDHLPVHRADLEADLGAVPEDVGLIDERDELPVVVPRSLKALLIPQVH
ncbi:hypothetical protein [Haloarchaeobius sp. DYHT-AS-18]|uniref:hypothetical protein n=1 Tax=Haloarchaeobius sp. DYHT-AS-18 TaxID=3446117 RepID=UPI003EBE89AE